MLLGAVFLGGGATLAALRKRAAHSNECDDFPECDQPSGLAKSCCSSTASLTGVLEAAEAAEAAASEEETTCKFCDATASCRFCFAGPERGELIAPCACVGSQVRKPSKKLESRNRRDFAPDCFSREVFFHSLADVFASPQKPRSSRVNHDKNKHTLVPAGARTHAVPPPVAEGFHAHARRARDQLPRV
jgi:hypothetical protein